MGKLAIFGPVFVLAFWTFVVLNVLGISRIRASARRVVQPDDFRLGESDRVPERVKLANRNYMNLLELPVLFYTLCVVVYVTGTSTTAAVVLAWLYVALRMTHSLIHLTSNNVMHRLSSFAASNTVLLALWVLVAISLWEKSVA